MLLSRLHPQLRICSFQALPSLYAAIKADTYTGEERKLSIFVSILEPDSVCALRILQVCLALGHRCLAFLTTKLLHL